MDSTSQPSPSIHEAAREGQVTIVESFLSADPKLVSKKDDDNRLPIHWAISAQSVPIVELLVSRPDFDPDVQDGSGWTPLMMAASQPEGQDIVEILLRKDADVNAKNFNGQTALHFCVSKNNIDVARRLVSQGASTRFKDKRGQLPLHRAAAIGSVPLVSLLLDNKSPLDATDDFGYTALHHAIAEGRGDTALELLKRGIDFTKEDSDGKLALELAPDSQVRKFVIQAAAREAIDLA